jgi:hypothetical protein
MQQTKRDIYELPWYFGFLYLVCLSICAQKLKKVSDERQKKQLLDILYHVWIGWVYAEVGNILSVKLQKISL